MTKFPALDTRHFEGEPRTKPKPVGQAGSPAIHKDQHRAARRQAGEPACGEIGAPSNAGHKFQPAESKAAVTQRLRAVATNHSRLSFELRGGRFSHRRQVGVFLLPHIRPVASTSRGWCVTPADILPIRTRTYAGLSPEQVAALLDTGHHVLQDTADVPESHSSVPSKVLSHAEHRDREDREACSSFRGIEFPQ